MDKGKGIAQDIEGTHYQIDSYEGGVSQTLSFKPELYKKIQNETDELSVKNIFKTKWFPGNNSIRYIAQKHENTIDITGIDGKARIHLVTDEVIKREISKLRNREAKRYKNVYFGGVEFTIKAYFQKNIDTPIQIYVVDDRILGNMQDALISVIKGNLIYQKIKFIIQPDFSISLEDKHKELALTLYYKLDNIKMPPGSKVMSIETKIIYALTGKHQVTKQHEQETLIPKIYREILEEVEHKHNSSITIPAEIEMDFNRRVISSPPRTIQVIEGNRISISKRPSMSRQLSKPRTINLISNLNKLRIKVVIFEEHVGNECIAEINTAVIRSFVNKNKIVKQDCINMEPQNYNYPGIDQSIVITKSTSLRFKIQDLEYNITLGVMENDIFTELVLGSDFLAMVNYNIGINEIEINDQGKTRFIPKI